MRREVSIEICIFVYHIVAAFFLMLDLVSIFDIILLLLKRLHELSIPNPSFPLLELIRAWRAFSGFPPTFFWWPNQQFEYERASYSGTISL